MIYIRKIYFYILNKLFRIDMNKEYKSYTIYYLDGSIKTFIPKEFSNFKDGIVNNLYLKNKCSIKVK